MKHRRGQVVLVMAAVTVAMGVVLTAVSPDLKEAQFAGSMAELRGFDQSDLRAGGYLDYLFMAAYAGLAWSLFSLIRDPRERERRHPGASAGALLFVAGALADAVENVFLLVALDRTDEWLIDAMRGAGLAKWALLGAGALTMLTLVLLRSWRAALPLGLPTDRPDHLPKAAWEPPAKQGAKPRVGVCLSGGGVRSAAFSLGALQVLRDKGKLDDASYLTAASGGGYLAAGWALSQAETGAATPPPWAPGSPEERWFRDHSSYLIPDTKGGIAGLARLLTGLLVNLLLVGILLAAVSRPVGWAMHGLHPELRAGAPAVLARDDASADVRVAGVRLLGTVESEAGDIARYELAVSPTSTAGACFYVPQRATQVDQCVGVAEDASARGVVEVQAGRAKVVRQPKVRINTGSGALAPKATVARQPEIGVVDELVVDGQAPGAGQFEVKHQPLVKTKTGLATMRYPTYDRWMWELVGGLLGGAVVVALAVTAFRPRGRRGEVLGAIGKALGGAGLVAFLVTVALPWAVVWLPRKLATLAGTSAESITGSSAYDYLLPGGGLVALVLASANQYLAGSKSKEGSGTGDTTSLFSKIKGLLSSRKAELKWYETSPMKIVVAVASVVAVVVVFVNSLQFAAANGPSGRLMGLSWVRDVLPWWAFLPDWAELVAMVAALVAFALLADAHSWSLFPFYKERLSSAYLLGRTPDGRAKPLRYDQLVPFTRLAGATGPQLVACCAVNLNEYGVVPPGRRAASFTFSSTEIGGPLVGYARPEDFERLPLSRRRDVTVASAMAISGAAFSPAMGKFNLGPIGTVLALANLRLGVWIPHPCRARVADKAHKEWDWWRFRRPHWVWFLRELTNKYAFNRRYLYVSDGGHWDNLGLVELLRRGCTEIYCISGAGDGATSFGTIGEAIALAREELGVEVELDPSPMRAPTTLPSPAPKRELRRKGQQDKATPYAPAPAVKGTLRFPNGAEGVIYYAEADLTVDMPFDVHAFAENEADFPDDSTGDQVFNHRQFESYRALGRHQAAAAAALADPPPKPTTLEKVKKALSD